MIAAGMAAPASLGAATKWTPTPTISWRSLKSSILKTQFTSDTRLVAAKSPAILAATAPSASPRLLIGAVPPLMLKTAANPGGLPKSAFDDIRTGVLTDRAQFFKDLSAPFYGANRPDAKVSQGLRDFFWLQGMLCGLNAAYDCIKAFSETDFTEDLKKIDVPTLILHGDDDQVVPIGASAMLSSKLIKNARLEIYKGAPHGMCSTLKDKVNADLLSFFKS